MSLRSIYQNYRWELFLVALTLAAGAWASLLSPFYLSLDQILYSLQQALAVAGLLAAGLMTVVLVGEIDISVPATLAMGTILLARLSEMQVPTWVAFPLVIGLGVTAGLINGLLVVGFGLPSLAVTLGTMAAYRALALLIGGQEGHANFDDSYLALGSALIGGVVPVSLFLLLFIYAAFVWLMHQTVFGRLIYMVGSNQLAMRYAGIRVAWVKIATFAIAGALAGLGAAVYVGQFGSARADNASEMLLFVVAAVVLGGIDIFGGRGHVAGVLLALLLLGTLKNGMGLANFPGPVQTLVIGALLVVSVAIPRFARLRFRLRSDGRGSSPGISTA
jgi:rhamnose transport system permease protein